MCYQKRVVFGLCNHSASLGLVRLCPNGKVCDEIRVHPLETVRVGLMCRVCTEKKTKADSSIATLRERVRMLREDLAKKGFIAQDGEEEGTGSSVTGSGTKEMESEGVAGQNKSDKNDMPKAEHLEIVPSNGTGSRSRFASASASASTPTSPTDVSFKRNDMFVGGVCLGSTSLTTVSGKRLL